MRPFEEHLVEPGDPPSKREILACALRLFVHEGLCETSIRAIGDAAGYTNPALYKFFASKDALALALFERCYGWVYEAMREAVEAQPFEAALGGVVQAWVRLLDERAEALLYVNETLREFWPKVRPATKRRSLLKLLAGVIARGQAAGVVPQSVAPPLAVALVVGTLGQVARQQAFGDLREVTSLAPSLTQLLTAALTRSSPCC
jgi:TetR/AcrR family transcriptional regulator, repressor of fatR-cypB operon